MTKKAAFWVTVALVLADLMAGLDATIINTAVPAIIADLHGIQYYGWIVAVFLLGVATSAPLWGKLGERIGNRAAFNWALGLFLVSSLLEGSATNIFFFIGARALMGIGGGGMGVLPYIMVAKVYQDTFKRTQALGYIAGAFSLASIIGPLVGGVIVDSISWRWIFYINIPVGLLGVALNSLYYRETVHKPHTKFDWMGTILLVGGLLSLLAGMQLIGLASGAWIGSLCTVGLLALVALAFAERRAQDPLLPARIFANKYLLVDFGLFVLSWGAFIAINTYTPFWAQSLLGMSALLGGMSLIPNSLADFVGTQTAAWFQTHFSPKQIIDISFIAMLLSAGGLALAHVTVMYWYLLVFASFAGFGVGLAFVILQIKVQNDAQGDDLASATSISYLVRILAQTVMSAVYGILLNWRLSQGVAASHGKVTLAMLNKLSDAASARSLPVQLVPQLRVITHSGLVTIMSVAALLLVVALGFNHWANRKKPRRIRNHEPLRRKEI